MCLLVRADGLRERLQLARQAGALERLGVERGLHVLEQQREVEDLRVLLGGRARERGFGVLAEHDAADRDPAERDRARLERGRRVMRSCPSSTPCGTCVSSGGGGAGRGGGGYCAAGTRSAGGLAARRGRPRRRRQRLWQRRRLEPPARRRGVSARRLAAPRAQGARGPPPSRRQRRARPPARSARPERHRRRRRCRRPPAGARPAGTVSGGAVVGTAGGGAWSGWSGYASHSSSGVGVRRLLRKCRGRVASTSISPTAIARIRALTGRDSAYRRARHVRVYRKRAILSAWRYCYQDDALAHRRAEVDALSRRCAAGRGGAGAARPHPGRARRLCGTTQSAVAQLERGTRPPRLDTLLRIANALDCELDVRLRPRTTMERKP